MARMRPRTTAKQAADTDPASTVNRSMHESADTPRVVDAAVAEFQRRYENPQLPKLAIVIAALDEEASIADVLDEIPGEIAGLGRAIIVIDDGSSDKTGAIAADHGALVCRLEQNCGHGTAMRTGYRLAREGGASYVATLDADGQWDPHDLPAMVALLEQDRADFVLGSRRLGHTENTDQVRNLGVRFFSTAISAATHTRITDSSSGLRAMRIEVPTQVRQTQPQYQTSELLIGAIYQGFRVAEVPTVMRVRHAGESKKGKNVFYGMRYAQVITRTVLRERRTRKTRGPETPGSETPGSDRGR
jgi:glycosyltransferase involved in cell wall biosynthesis